MIRNKCEERKRKQIYKSARNPLNDIQISYKDGFCHERLSNKTEHLKQSKIPLNKRRGMKEEKGRVNKAQNEK